MNPYDPPDDQTPATPRRVSWRSVVFCGGVVSMVGAMASGPEMISSPIINSEAVMMTLGIGGLIATAISHRLPK